VGPTFRVHAATLKRQVAELGNDVDTLVFAKEPFAPAVELIREMLDRFSSMEVDALVGYLSVTEAVKRTDHDIVQAGLDRSSIVAVTGPEIVSRSSLTEALDRSGHEVWVNPIAIIARHGGRVALYPDENPEAG
ncbi:MAG TPA: hypothetical protein VFD97_04055, partial [Acidimicrobiia bacterium]|nr:hypothetical protein [Acidimicrobiia bacterium]